MTNRVMRRRMGLDIKPVKPQRMIKVYNRMPCPQFHGIWCLPSEEWAEVPEDLAIRLVNDPNYEISDPILNPKSNRKRPSLVQGKSVDIIIPVHNQLKFLKQCILSVKQNTSDYRLIIVDDGSDKEVADWIDEQGFDEVIRNKKPQGFGKSCNAGILKSTAPWICVLNSDTIVTPFWMAIMQSVASMGFGIVGPTTSHSSGLQCDHRISVKRHQMYSADIVKVADEKLRKNGTKFTECDVFGFCMIFNQAVVKMVGGFDHARYLEGYYEDWDFVWRAQMMGFRSAWAEGAYVHHYGGTSFFDKIGMDKVHALSDRNCRIFEARKASGDELYFEMRVRKANNGKGTISQSA